MHGILVLEDGHFFRGDYFSLSENGGGEVVFNTSPTGYQEILTDPSYAGQIVVLTTAHVGNYGVTNNDNESSVIHASGLIVRDYHPIPSNWSSLISLADYLNDTGIPAMGNVDTRALVLHIRDQGALRGVLRWLPDTMDSLPLAGKIEDNSCYIKLWTLVEQARKIPSMGGLDLVSRVTCDNPYALGKRDARLHVIVIDFGVKRSILQQLLTAGCRITVVPASSSLATIEALKPDGVLLSNGPGDPAPVQYAVQTIRGLLGKIPIFGICLGHQLLALACGGTTYKLPFGHRGGNHPVRDVQSRRVEITAQNHGFAVHGSSLDDRQVVVTHINLNDGTVEGIRHCRFPAFSVQFHPEASPGPHDSHSLFARFISMMEVNR